MTRGMVRGALGAAGGLIVLEALVQKNGADAVGGLMGALVGVVNRVLDPTVAAIPDHSSNAAGAGTTDANGNYHPTVPGFLGGGTTTAPGDNTSGQQANPNVVPYDPPPPGGWPTQGGGNLVPDAYRVPYLAPVTRNA